MRTVLGSAERSCDERLDLRQTGEVAGRPPLMVVEPRHGRDQLNLSPVDRRRHSDGVDGDAGPVRFAGLGLDRVERRRRLAVGDEQGDTRHAVTLALNNNDNDDKLEGPFFGRLPEPNRAWLLVVYFSR